MKHFFGSATSRAQSTIIRGLAGIANGQTEFRLPIIGKLAAGQQYRIAGAAFVVAAAVCTAAVVWHAQLSSERGNLIAATTHLGYGASQIGKESRRVSAGLPGATKNLNVAYKSFERDLDLIVASTRGSATEKQVAELNKLWHVSDTAVERLIERGSSIERMQIVASKIDALVQRQRALLNRVQPVVIQSQSLVFARQRMFAAGVQLSAISEGALKMASSDGKPEHAEQVRNSAAKLVSALKFVAAAPLDLRLDFPFQSMMDEAIAISNQFSPLINDITAQEGLMRQIVEAREGVDSVYEASNTLALAADAVRQTVESDSRTINIAFSIGVISAILAIASLIALALIYGAQSRAQAQAEAAKNREQQAAIMQLLNELSDLAEGDLTKKATVTEQITGALADSVNYTIDELRMLVGKIISASNEVGAGSAEVREHAYSGADAVMAAVAGMNEIREQIQETAKRIKRLGESSQEISEIVNIISDISEQTNVLAMNASIQAASAGEAGRGFSVVASEVQKLAERAAESTRSIGALVQSIQTDSAASVKSMEASTEAVVNEAQRTQVASDGLKSIVDAADALQANAAQLAGSVAGFKVS